MFFGKRGQDCHKDYDSICKNSGVWGDMRITNSDGEQYIIPAEMLSKPKTLAKIQKGIRDKDEEYTAKYRA